MVKRTSHILISLLLVIATTGVTFTRHYCGENLISSSVFGNTHNCCGAQCNSCHTEISNFKVADNFVASAFKMDDAQQLSLDWLATPGIDLFSTSIDHYFSVNKFFFSSSPPTAENPSALLQIFRC